MDSPETEPLEWDSDQGTPQASRHPSLSPSNSRTKPFKTLNSVGSVHDTARAKRDAETAERYLTYVDQLPYKAESIEQAQDKLSHIVHNLLTAVHAQDWTVTVRHPPGYMLHPAGLTRQLTVLLLVSQTGMLA